MSATRRTPSRVVACAALVVLAVAACSGGGPSAAPDPAALAPSGADDPCAGRDLEPFGSFDEGEVVVTDADGSRFELCVLVAATPAQTRRGLMEREDLGGFDAMVFVFESDRSGGFWMKDVPVALSVAWFRADGSFVSATDMAPCVDYEDAALECPNHLPEGVYRYALEVLAGDLESVGVGPGSSLAFA